MIKTSWQRLEPKCKAPCLPDTGEHCMYCCTQLAHHADLQSILFSTKDKAQENFTTKTTEFSHLTTNQKLSQHKIYFKNINVTHTIHERPKKNSIFFLLIITFCLSTDMLCTIYTNYKTNFKKKISGLQIKSKWRVDTSAMCCQLAWRKWKMCSDEINGPAGNCKKHIYIYIDTPIQ